MKLFDITYIDGKGPLPRKAKIVCQNFCLDLSFRGSKDLILQNDKKYNSKVFLHSSKSKFDGTCLLLFFVFLYLLPGTSCAKKEKKTSLILPASWNKMCWHASLTRPSPELRTKAKELGLIIRWCFDVDILTFVMC